MSNYIFYGSVLPERCNVSFSKFTCNIPDINIDIVIECNLSKIVSFCSSKNEKINLDTLKNYTEHTARTIVDIIGFERACGYDVEIESAYNLDTNQLIKIFDVHESIFENPKINEDTLNGIPHPDIMISFLDLVKLSGLHMEIQIALSDFREAIRQPNFTSFHCYRAIEALSQTFAGNDNKQWEMLRKTLNIERKDIDSIKNYADALRHGKPCEQSWEDRKQHMYTTWKIIKKHIEWHSKNLTKI